jgi:phosphoenolpyruvate-protein kinase (PTS system EI component)
MSEQRLRGAPASPGSALGTAWRRATGPRADQRVAWEDHELERDAALTALQRAAEELTRLAGTLPADEAEIVEAGALMANDPALIALVEQRVLGSGLPAADAILSATQELADSIAGLPDATLAARADDVRSLGHRAARLSSEAGRELPPPDAVLIDEDVGPADVAELAEHLAGVATVGGGVTAHAAIVARSLGIPMVTGLAEESLRIPRGVPVALDGTDGALIVNPGAQHAAQAADAMRVRREADSAAAEHAGQPAVTADGERIEVLVNAASAAEVQAGLRAGAEGIGLLRTELPFLDAAAWPTEEQHIEALGPILAALPRDRPAIVRVLDIGPDKSPPFAAGLSERGIELLLKNEPQLLVQLRAVAACARDRDVLVLVPMVDSPEQLEATRALLTEAMGSPPLRVGAMVETAAAVAHAPQIAGAADFLSIGTNDLTASILGLDRFATSKASAHDPRVLRAIAATVDAARSAGKPVEVCGEAASDPLMVPLLIGLGVRQLSVGAARVGSVRGWVRGLDLAGAERAAQTALSLGSADEVQEALAGSSAPAGDGGAERVERRGGVAAFGPQS